MPPNEKVADLHPPEVHEVHVDLKKLPSWSKLNERVRKIEEECSWWDLYGHDWLQCAFIVALIPGGLQMLRSEKIFDFSVGVILLGCAHGTLTNRFGHMSAHGALCRSRTLSALWTRFFIEFIGAYSYEAGMDAHVHMHHPHTNIIGLGDSSMWKVPLLPCWLYMFVSPLFIPLTMPFFALKDLVESKKWKEVPKFLMVMGSGQIIQVAIFMHIVEFSLAKSVLTILVLRGVLGIPYIHINIFQHIGLPMYSQKYRPARMYQMATGVLNLEGNRFLDWTFGHTLVKCHIEHHLFPRLSDNMVMKIKPLVKEYLEENGLLYQEDSYWNRLKMFVTDYQRLMVNAPPITHFIGIQ